MPGIAPAVMLLLVQEILKVHGWEKDYPLFTTVSRIVDGYCPPSDIVNFLEVRPEPAALKADLSAVCAPHEYGLYQHAGCLCWFSWRCATCTATAIPLYMALLINIHGGVIG